VIEKQGLNDDAEAIYKGAIEMQETQDPRDSSIVADLNVGSEFDVALRKPKEGELEAADQPLIDALRNRDDDSIFRSLCRDSKSSSFRRASDSGRWPMKVISGLLGSKRLQRGMAAALPRFFCEI
jgi:hypothetical protein